MSMKFGGRENKGFAGGRGGPPADLLVCFPSRARLALMPKPICSPVRPNSEPNKRPGLKKINTTRGRAGGGPPSPLLWAKGKQTPPDLAEPTSPKVTCAGQIKVRPRSSAACRNWQSVMEEIERLHNSRRSSRHSNDKTAALNKGGGKKSSWGDALGFKKDIVGFLTCLGNIKFDFRCFGSFPHPEMSSDEEADDEEEEEQEEEEDEDENNEEDRRNNTVFSKWYMVLQENQDVDKNTVTAATTAYRNDENEDPQEQVPPPNALQLMRCRSAPAVKRFDSSQVQSTMTTTSSVGPAYSSAQGDNEKAEDEAVNKDKKPKKKRRESLAIVMKYDTDFYDMSPEICKETWLVGDLRDAINLARSRSCKR